MSIVHAKEKIVSFSAKYWTIIAFLSGVFFSLHNLFFFSQVKSQHEMGALICIPYWIGEMPPVLAALGFKWFKHYSIHGVFWRKETSKYYKEGRVDWFNLSGLTVRLFLLFIGQFMFYYVLYCTELAQANLAVIASMFALAAFFTAFVFWLLF